MKPKKTGLKKQKHDFKKSLDELRTIGEWFSDREEVDVEQGLEKAKKGAKLIKICKKRLEEVENEFNEIKKELE